MARQRFSRPEVKRRGKRTQLWVIDFHQYVVGPDGKERRKHIIEAIGSTKRMTKGEAQRQADEIVAKATGTYNRPDGETTLERFWSEVYEPLKSGRWASQTRDQHMSTWRNHLGPTLGAVKLQDLRKHMLERLLLDRAKAGAGEALLEHILGLAHGILEEAVENEYITRNPARHIVIPDARPDIRTRSLTEEEVARLFSHTEGRDRLMWRLLVLCGLRLGELRALTRSDILATGLLIDEGVVKDAAARTKNRKLRIAPLAPSLRADLEAWAATSGEILFPGVRTRYLSLREYEFVEKRGRAAAGIPDLTFRMARTTFATLFQGDPADVQAILGHHSAEFTLEHYRRAVPARQQAAVEELEARLSQTQKGRVN